MEISGVYSLQYNDGADFNPQQICLSGLMLNRPDIPVALQRGHTGHSVRDFFFMDGGVT